MEAVEVHTCNIGFLGIVCGFFVNDGSQGEYLDGGDACSLCLFYTGGSPEGIGFLFHTFHELVHRYVPVYFVRIGNENGHNGVGVTTVFGTFFGAVENIEQRGGVRHQFFAEFGSQILFGTYGRYGEFYRCLQSTAHVADYAESTFARFDFVLAAVYTVLKP